MVAAGLGIKRSLAEAAVRSDLVERVRLENELGEIPPRCLALIAVIDVGDRKKG